MKVVKDTIAHRDKYNVKRGDLLDILMQLRGKDLHAEEFTDPEKEASLHVGK